jgi:hypothetical protein
MGRKCKKVTITYGLCPRFTKTSAKSTLGDSRWPGDLGMREPLPVVFFRPKTK